MYKIIIAIAALVVGQGVAQAQSQCQGNFQGRHMVSTELVSTWQCDIAANVGGFSVGYGGALQLMAGEGQFTCEAYDHQGQFAGCYKEDIAMGLLGRGVGIGLSLVDTMAVDSVGINLLDLKPEEFMDIARLGIGANAGVHLGDVAKLGQISMDVSLFNGINFSLGFSNAKGIGLYAGAQVNAFVMVRKGENGVIIDSGSYLDKFLDSIASILQGNGAIDEGFMLVKENIVFNAKSAKTQAINKYPGYKNFGTTITAGQNDLEGDRYEDFVNTGLKRSSNICQGRTKSVYAAFRCDGLTCSQAYFRAVCNERK